MHDGQTGPTLYDHQTDGDWFTIEASRRRRGLIHRLLVWFCSRPGRNRTPW